MVCQRYGYHKCAENNEIINLSLESVTRKVTLMKRNLPYDSPKITLQAKLCLIAEGNGLWKLAEILKLWVCVGG